MKKDQRYFDLIGPNPKPSNRHYINEPVTKSFTSPRPYIPDVVSQEHVSYTDVEPVGDRNRNHPRPLPELPVEKIVVPPVTQLVMRNGKIIEKTVRKGQVLRRTNIDLRRFITEKPEEYR